MSDMEVELIHHCGDDLTVVNAARVSFDKESEWDNHSGFQDTLHEADTKLIKYLAKNKHISPFGHCFASFRVKAPVFVARQLVKHKFLRWNEVSRRYVSSTPEFYEPEVWRKKAENVKQGSSEEAVELSEGEINGHPMCHRLDSFTYVDYSMILYNQLLSDGVCPEQARMVLPQSMMTEWWWSGSLDAFADMCRLRLDSHSQKETQVVAEQISKHMGELFPVSWAALLGED